MLTPILWTAACLALAVLTAGLAAWAFDFPLLLCLVSLFVREEEEDVDDAILGDVIRVPVGATPRALREDFHDVGDR